MPGIARTSRAFGRADADEPLLTRRRGLACNGALRRTKDTRCRMRISDWPQVSLDQWRERPDIAPHTAMKEALHRKRRLVWSATNVLPRPSQKRPAFVSTLTPLWRFILLIRRRIAWYKKPRSRCTNPQAVIERPKMGAAKYSSAHSVISAIPPDRIGVANQASFPPITVNTAFQRRRWDQTSDELRTQRIC
jgi:hypothetical protein